MTRGAGAHIIEKTAAHPARLLLVLLKILVVLLCVMGAPWLIGATERET